MMNGDHAFLGFTQVLQIPMVRAACLVGGLVTWVRVALILLPRLSISLPEALAGITVEFGTSVETKCINSGLVFF